MKKMRYLGTEDESLVIFEIDEEDVPNAYVWVFLPGGREPMVKIEPVTRLYSYINQTDAQFYVKEDKVEKVIEKALEIIEEMPKEKLQEELKLFNDRFEIDETYRNRWYDEMEQVEIDTLKEIEKARNADGYWPE